MSLPATPGQTIGPFFGYALPYDGAPLLVPADHPDAVLLHGRVLDGAGDPVPDALLELWQAAPEGRVGDGFAGFGRAETDAEGRYAFTTLTPAAPFFALTVLARGLTDRLFTRAYLPEHPGVAQDPLLAALALGRRRTLLVLADDDGWRFDVRLQGEDETVFLTYPRH
ncbi:MAG: protocatechuate 3,4-dioxygenase subunit alpha [Nocardioides sp.]|nr:protocatechuate 3,4-dioxygenase subunit alpha [Nocardioides sp.]